MTNWNQRFFDTAHTIAQWSKNRGTKVGAVMFHPASKAVVSMGYNAMVAGMDDDLPHYHEAPLKALVFEHAERNCIFHAARYGIGTEGMGMAVTWYPCAPCARAIVASGLVELVAVRPNWLDEKWGPDWLAAADILHAGTVKVTYLAPPGSAPDPATQAEETAAPSNIVYFPAPLVDAVTIPTAKKAPGSCYSFAPGSARWRPRPLGDTR